MPELPEVETSRSGIAPHTEKKIFKAVIIRQQQLRWPVPNVLTTILPGLMLESVKRRGKYLLLTSAQGTVILHLGMSGNLRITTTGDLPGKHDHIDFIFEDGTVLRLNDQRKFGAVLWTSKAIDQHSLILKLGPEPLTEFFNGAYLLECSKNRTLPIKCLLMDSNFVVGVGNIYASESLFMAGIHPNRPIGKLSLQECGRLAEAVKSVLQQAIELGGTTLRDFTNPQGKPGYFQQSLRVYGRTDQPCFICSEPIRLIKIRQRSSFFCNICQF